MKGYWYKTSYQEGLEACCNVKHNQELYQRCCVILKELNLSDKKMNGNSIMGLPGKREKHRGSDITYSNIFHTVARGSYITPVYYFAKVVEACIQKGIYNKVKIKEISTRGFYAFASFLRELDLAYKLTEAISDAVCNSNPDQDVKDHTDILLKCNDKVYRIWSYQWSEKNEIGLKNTCERLLEGKNGGLPEGIHILCPINIFLEADVEDIAGWKFYSDRYIEKIKYILGKEMESYKSIEVNVDLGKDHIFAYLKQIHMLNIEKE